MSKKHSRGKGGKALSDRNGVVRKQKAAKYADRNLKKADSSDNSLMEKSEGEVSEVTQLDNFTDKADSGKPKSRKGYSGNNGHLDDMSEPQSGQLHKKTADMQQEAEKSISKSRTADNNTADEENFDSHSESDRDKNAQRMKKAEYIKQKTEMLIAAETLKPAYEDCSDNIADGQHETVNISEERENSDSNSTSDRYKKTESPIPAEAAKNIDDNIARQYKKAAYIKGKMLNRSAPGKEQAHSADNSLSADADRIEDKDKLKNEFAAQKYTDRKYGQIGEYSEHYRDELPKNKSPDSGAKLTSVGIIRAAEDTADYVSAVQSGDAAKVVALPIKKIIEMKYGENKTVRTAKVVSSAVKNSDSIGGAAAGIGTAIAADKVKQYVSGLIFGRTDKNHKQRDVKKYRYIKKENITKCKTERAAKSQRYKIRSARKNAAAKKNLQKNFYLKSSKDVPAYVPKTSVVRRVQKKMSAKLIAFAAAMTVPLFIVLIAITLVSSMFSWLEPFEFTLAGSDSETSAETSGEILDGYTLMIQNYVDIAQAKYYLEYGDWYGGTYDYPSAEDSLSFSEFLSSKCEYIIATIREQFSNAISNAPNEQARAEIAQAMGEAITNALREAQEGAAEEYQALIERLEDTMTAEEKRQHYEVKNNGGANGIADTIEFDEKPIEGTNFFGNVLIESDLSAEELLAMTALYKSLLLIQSGGSTEDGTDYEYNITPEDIMTFFKDTEYIPITVEVTHNHSCPGQNCRQLMQGDYESGYFWEYYCLADHDNLNGSIDRCIGRDELLEKIMELTEAEENGFDSGQCEKMFDEYVKTIKKELDIDEGDFRQFGAADNERAKDFYEILIDPAQGEIINNYWDIPTPFENDESEESSDE